MSIIAAAETGYVAKHTDRGYACTLATLFAQDPEAAAQGEGGGFFDPGQGNEEWNGYRFTLTGCDGTPAAKYRISAAPTDMDSGMKTFCADESGTLKFVTSGKSSSCFSRGQVVSTGAPTTSEE